LNTDICKLESENRERLTVLYKNSWFGETLYSWWMGFHEVIIKNLDQVNLPCSWKSWILF